MFYWAAMTSSNDAAHERAMALSCSLSPDKTFTTDEVLCDSEMELLPKFATYRLPAQIVPTPANSAAVNHNRVLIDVPVQLFRMIKYEIRTSGPTMQKET